MTGGTEHIALLIMALATTIPRSIFPLLTSPSFCAPKSWSSFRLPFWVAWRKHFLFLVIIILLSISFWDPLLHLIIIGCWFTIFIIIPANQLSWNNNAKVINIHKKGRNNMEIRVLSCIIWYTYDLLPNRQLSHTVKWSSPVNQSREMRTWTCAKLRKGLTHGNIFSQLSNGKTTKGWVVCD